MAGSRTLTLKLLADINNFTDNLNKGSKSAQTLEQQISDFSKKAALAFAALGAAAVAYGKQAVEAAAADESAQIKLAATIEATTKASQGQIKAVEDYITKTSIAIGITDDELRPAFARLVRSTNDVEKAQILLNLALDLQAATGKPLESVTNALGKAYDGNTAALGKLGLGIDQSTIKSKDFNRIFTELDATFGTFAEDTAGTTQKSLDRVRIALDEANESIGMALLPIVQQLTAWLLENFVPALNAVIDGLTGERSMVDSIDETYDKFYNWGQRIRGIINILISLKEEILIVTGVMAAMFIGSKIAAGIAATISTINLLIKAYNALKASAFVAGVAAYFALNPLAGVAASAAGIAIIAAASKYISGFGGGNEVSIPAGATEGAAFLGGNVYGSNKTVVGSTAGGSIITGGNTAASTGIKVSGLPTFPSGGGLSGGIKANSGFNPSGSREFDNRGVINVTVNGAIDPASTARQIVDLLNNEAASSGTFSQLGTSRWALRAE